MILRPKLSLNHFGTFAGAAAAMPVATVPDWLRRAIPNAQNLASKDVEDVALVAGAAAGALDALVRREEKSAGAWRQRLALVAAAATARQASRVEDEAALRDSFLFSSPGNILSGSPTLGPAGLFLLAWRRLAEMPAEKLLTEKNLAAVVEEFGFFVGDDEAVSDLADDLRQLGAGAGMVGMLTGAFVAAERHGFGQSFGAWLADALLAQRLGWAHAVPLLGTEVALAAGMGSSRPRRSVSASAAAAIETESDRVKSQAKSGAKCPTKNPLAALARAALRAIDLSAELERRADKLLAVAPKLRARGADRVIDRLLNEDALIASRGDSGSLGVNGFRGDNGSHGDTASCGDKKKQKSGMSDRSLRRLFDRLVSLSAVRELSGRPTFRIYGL